MCWALHWALGSSSDKMGWVAWPQWAPLRTQEAEFEHVSSNHGVTAVLRAMRDVPCIRGDGNGPDPVQWGLGKEGLS